MSNLSTGPLWSTYFGGSAADRVRKTLVMPDGSIYIGGETKSIEDGSKFETTSDALQGTRDGTSGKYDAFLAKFKIESSNLNLKSFTFFGGNGDDRIKDINLFHSNATANNNADSIAIVGLTSSNNLNSAGLLSTNADSVSKILHGTEDAFFAVITGTGTTQLHSFACYVGGANIEDEKNSYGPTIALGPIGVEYIGFSTTSSNVKSACKVNTQTGSYNNPGDSSTHDVYVGKIYPFVEHYAAPCPTCNPCKLDGSENSYDAALEFYPVPFNNEVNLKVNALKDAEAMIRIYNSMGQEILRQKISVVQGSNVTKLNLQGQPSGIYLCRILIDNKIETAKIIKE
ncbi:MAG: T9SS type A sorting domain-containing protein [Chitinophagales bacterium]|nr:T9SS type A sorting domain-containing protein [Chitinophagales bacterium]